MNASTVKRTKWFWPWQDEKEEAWLEKMSQDGFHLKSVQLLCSYTFEAGEPRRYSYRLDYIAPNKKDIQEYRQIFQDAGWEHLGEMSNWQYWRKRIAPGETSEIFTDTESKLRKYRRMLGYMGFFLFFLVFLGTRIFFSAPWYDKDYMLWINIVYMGGKVVYAVIIPIYLVVVIQLLRRINELKKKAL